MRTNNKLTQIRQDIQERGDTGRKMPWHDLRLSTNERKQKYREYRDAVMNPVDPNDFSPNNWEPFQDHPDNDVNDRGSNRTIPNKILPTNGLKPKPIDEGQMIGMYESKQDLYLIFAWRCNELQKEVDALKVKVVELENR